MTYTELCKADNGWTVGRLLEFLTEAKSIHGEDCPVSISFRCDVCGLLAADFIENAYISKSAGRVLVDGELIRMMPCVNIDGMERNDDGTPA